MRYLILIDKKYPFDKGEPFLENEIVNYKHTIDKLIIFPIDIGKGSKLTRNVPLNVDVHLSNKKSTKLFKLKVSFKSILLMALKKNITTIAVNGYKKSIKSAWFAAYFNNICEEKTKSIIKILRSYNIKNSDEVIVYSYWLYTTACIALSVKDYFKNNGIEAKVISRAHRFDIYDDKLPFKKEMITALDRIYPCSNDGAKYLKDRYSFAKDRINVAYLGTIDHGIQKNIYDTKKFVIVSCSRITKIKRVERIARTLKLIDVSKIGKRIKWIHIGSGKNLKKIRNYCAKNLPHIEVEFKGFIPNCDVYKLYQKEYLNLFINVSLSEGLPVSIMEAISFGLPVIATDVGGTREIVLDKYNGRILDADFEDTELAHYIESFIIMDKSLYCTYRENSRKLWEEKFNANKNYKMFLKNIYNDID